MEEIITQIEELDYDIEMIDIEVNVNHLFFANNILTHNSNSDIDITNVSESMGISHTVDLFLVLISTEQLDKSNQIMFKQLKNRYNDLSKHKRFTVGIDRGKMRLYDIADPTANISVDGDTAQAAPAPSQFVAGKTNVRSNNFGGFKI